MAKKKSDITPEERDFFRHSIKINRTVISDKEVVKQQKTPKLSPPTRTKHSIEAYLGLSHSLLEKLCPNDWLMAEDYIHFARSGIPYRTLSKLKRGHLPIDARIDLHGLTGDEMLENMTHFLQHCNNHDYRVLLVVHGKGGSQPGKPPILKNILNYWLREQPQVLAFHSAKPEDGGRGALYLLLKHGD